jgi:hypothetical protein
VPTFEEFKEITSYHPYAMDTVKELIEIYDKQGTMDFSALVQDGFLKPLKDPYSGDIVPVTTKVTEDLKQVTKTVNIG